MNNYELHSRAQELSASHSGYNLARRLLALEEELKEVQREFGQSRQGQGEPVADEAFGDEFEHWWDEHGQFVRSGGGYYEKTFAFAAFRHLMPEVLAYRSSVPAAASPEWREAIGKALDRALVFDDGSDGADAESASSVVAILSDLLRDPRMTGREPLPAPAAVPEADHLSRFIRIMSEVALDLDGGNEWDDDPIPEELWQLYREATRPADQE